MEFNRKYFKELLELIKDNPELPVIPLVDEEVVGGDDYANWIGNWGMAEIVEVVFGREQFFVRGEDDPPDVLNDCLEDKDYWEEPEEIVESLYESLPWTKVISVYITSPC